MKRIRLSGLCILILIFIGMSSCRKEIPTLKDPEDGVATSFVEVFDRFYQAMNSYYQFWDADPTNWNEVHSKYRPLFEKLDINNDDDQRRSVGYFNEMLSENMDGHLLIVFHTKALTDSVVDPRTSQNLSGRNPMIALGEFARTEDYYGYTYYELDTQHYIDQGFLYGTYQDELAGVGKVLCGTVGEHVLYLGFDLEVFSSAVKANDPNVFKSAFSRFSETLKNDKQLRGVVVDMRGSLGGFGTDANLLASLMIDRPALMGQVRYKSGPGRLDYTPWTDTFIYPASGATALKVPLIILTDVFTYSAGEVVTAALKAVPKAVTVGSATLGGITGSRGIGGLQGKGSTTIKTKAGDFLTLSMVTSAFRSPSGDRPMFGIKPDYLVPFDPKAIEAGRDVQLEKALSLIGK